MKTEYRVYYSWGFSTHKSLKDAEFKLMLAKIKYPDAYIQVHKPEFKWGGSDCAFG